MKQLLLLYVLLICMVCKGQNLIYTDGSQNYLKVPNKKAKVYPPHSHQLGIETCFTTLPPSYSYQCSICKKEFNTLDSFFVGRSNAVNNSWYKPITLDTIPVIMLYSNVELQDFAQWNNGIERNNVKDYDYSTKWMKGYSITRSDTWGSFYLDADKKPLPKSIVVWVSKSLK